MMRYRYFRFHFQLNLIQTPATSFLVGFAPRRLRSLLASRAAINPSSPADIRTPAVKPPCANRTGPIRWRPLLSPHLLHVVPPQSSSPPLLPQSSRSRKMRLRHKRRRLRRASERLEASSQLSFTHTFLYLRGEGK